VRVDQRVADLRTQSVDETFADVIGGQRRGVTG
jgi:hypothetical protein